MDPFCIDKKNNYYILAKKEPSKLEAGMTNGGVLIRDISERKLAERRRG